MRFVGKCSISKGVQAPVQFIGTFVGTWNTIHPKAKHMAFEVPLPGPFELDMVPLFNMILEPR